MARADPCIDGEHDDGEHSIARDPVPSVKGRTALPFVPQKPQKLRTMRRASQGFMRATGPHLAKLMANIMDHGAGVLATKSRRPPIAPTQSPQSLPCRH